MSFRIRYATVVSLSIAGLSLVAACGSPTKSTAAPVVTSDGSAGSGHFHAICCRSFVSERYGGQHGDGGNLHGTGDGDEKRSYDLQLFDEG